VHRHLDAFNRRDLDAVVDGFAEDAVFDTGHDAFVGRRAIAQLFADALAAPVKATLELRTAVCSADVAACELTERLSVGGVEQDLAVAAFYTVKGGHLARVKVYREGSARLET
jgi:hypothetical protein